MVRTAFTGRLVQLQQDLRQMGDMVLSRLDGVIAAQAKLDQHGESIDYDDDSINQIWRKIEDEAVGVLALQQPVVAGDLRLVTFTLVVIQELEHISDFARDAVKELNMIGSAPAQLPVIPDVSELQQHARTMVALGLQAFEQGNVDLARGLGGQLADVHKLARRLPDTLKSYAWADAQAFEAVLGMVEVVNLWERIANHAAEIGERVIYLLTDKHEDLHTAGRDQMEAARTSTIA